MAVNALDSSLPSSFVACVEDRAATSSCRHQESAQNVLFAATRVAARALTSSPSHVCHSGETSEQVNAELEAAYQALLRERHKVPEPLRREWFEVALTLLARQAPACDERAWWWWLRFPSSGAEAAEGFAGDSAESDARTRKARTPRWKPWALWDDPRRQLTFLTLRTRPVKRVTDKGQHLKLEAMRPEDINRLDGPAFCARVRLFLRSPNLALGRPPRERRAEEEEKEAGMSGTEPPSAVSHLHEAEMYDAFLRFLIPPCGDLTPEARAVAQRQCSLVSAAVRYRMLVEVCCIRLHHTPRCVVTWNLLVDSLTVMLDHAVAASERAETVEKHKVALTLVRGVIVYTSAYLIPYLKLRDRHIEGSRGSFYRANAAVFSTPQLAHGMWESLIVSDGLAPTEAVSLAATVGVGAGAVQPPPLKNPTPVCVTMSLSAFVARSAPGLTLTDALEHVAVAAPAQAVHTPADLEAIAECATANHSASRTEADTAEEALGEAILSVLGFRDDAKDDENVNPTADSSASPDAVLFLSTTARHAALDAFVSRFFHCAPTDAFERAGVPREADSHATEAE